MNFQCSWKVSDDRPISDAIFYSRETDDSDLEDEINVENCVFLKAPDKCEGLYPTVPACQLLISCEPPNQITRISAICEARVLEIYGHHGEYLKTVFNSPLEETENLFVYRGDVVLDKPLSVCSVKFVNLESQNEMWLFGVKIHTDKMSHSPLNQASSLPFSSLSQRFAEMGDTLGDKEALKRFADNFLKMGLASSLPQGAAITSVFNNLPTYVLNPGLEMANNNEVQNANILNSEGKVHILEKESTQASLTTNELNKTEELKTFASSATSPVMMKQTLRCVSYNILADLYADTDTARNDLFPYCPIDALMVDYRKQLYLKEIIGYNGDIICLQEVDRKIFSDDLLPVLSTTGLEGLYNEKGGRVVEGLACFYRASKFKLIESHSIILSEAFPTEPVLQKMYSKINENEKLKEKIMSRTTALQVVLLESTDAPKKRVLVGNTHLYFHPKSDNIRLIQGSSCILYLESLLLKYRQQDPSYTTGLIFSGDFNSSPDCGIYQLITSRHLKNTFKDWNSNPEEFVPGLALEHSLSMASACGIPDYTNYTEGFVGCLDYIYYDASTFKVCDVVPFPKHEQVIKNRAIPSVEFPSDHLALISTLEWK